MIEFVVSPAFRDKLPKLTDAEFNQLRDNILEDGIVKRPLVVWFGTLEGETESHYYLIDGHNRWKIIQENWELLKDKYQVEIKEFANQYYAEAWMYKNQRGQRNLSDLWQDKINGEIVKAEIKAVGAAKGHSFYGNQHSPSLLDTSEPISTDKPKSTVQRVAKELNVPEGTLKKQLAFVRGLDAAEKVEPGFQNEILSGATKASKKDIMELRKLQSDEEVKAAVEEIRNPKRVSGNPKGFTKEMREQKSLVDEVIAEMYSPELKPFTIEMLEGDLEINGQNYIDMLRNTLVERSTLLVGDNRQRVAAKLDHIISEIQKIRRLVE